MTAFLIGLAIGFAIEAVYLAFRRANRTLTEAEQFQKARAATTPDDWRPL